MFVEASEAVQRVVHLVVGKRRYGDASPLPSAAMRAQLRKLTYPIRRWPRLSKAAIGGAVVLVAVVIGANAYILLSTGGEATASVAGVPQAQVAIVPGALVQPNGKMSA